MEGYIGQVMLFAGPKKYGWPPKYWLPCNGQLLYIHLNQALFSIIGNEYGGDGRTTFKLPNLAPVGKCQYIICVAGAYPSRP